MQSAARIAVSIFLLTSAYSTASYHSSPKLRRDGMLSLYPQPRVGRASSRTWEIPLNQLYLDKSSEYEQMQKRQLYAFPRVGRSNSRLYPAKPYLRYARDQFYERDPAHEDGKEIQVSLRRTDSPGMWFGPRLGRSFTSEEDDITIDSNEQEEADNKSEDSERPKRLSKPL